MSHFYFFLDYILLFLFRIRPIENQFNFNLPMLLKLVINAAQRATPVQSISIYKPSAPSSGHTVL